MGRSSAPILARRLSHGTWFWVTAAASVNIYSGQNAQPGRGYIPAAGHCCDGKAPPWDATAKPQAMQDEPLPMVPSCDGSGTAQAAKTMKKGDAS